MSGSEDNGNGEVVFSNDYIHRTKTVSKIHKHMTQQAGQSREAVG